MKITETFTLPDGKAARLFWTPGYIGLAQAVYRTYTDTKETSERARHASNCAARWGISRRCTEAILTGQCEYILSGDTVTITRPVVEE
jgi:hypothetical protein